MVITLTGKRISEAAPHARWPGFLFVSRQIWIAAGSPFVHPHPSQHSGSPFSSCAPGDPSPPGLGSCALGSPLRPGSTAGPCPAQPPRCRGRCPRASGSRAAPLRTWRAARLWRAGGPPDRPAVRPLRVRVAQRPASTSVGMPPPDAPGGDWPAALACMRTACDRVKASMNGSGCDAACAYSRAVSAWVRGLPKDGGSRAALQQPDSVRSAASRLPAQPPALGQARVAFTEAVRRARSLAWPRAHRARHVSQACTLSSRVRALAACASA